MPFELHATRAKRWFDNEGFEITTEEWRAIVAEDDELSVPAPHEAFVGSGELTRWDGHPDGEPRWLWLHEGTLSIRDPDEITIEKLAELAARLGAMVQSDDGEPFVPASSRAPRRGVVRRAWRLLRGR